MTTTRLFTLFAGLAGLCGIMLAAASTHVLGGDNAMIAANFLLFHAIALIGLAALITHGVAIHATTARIAGYVLIIGAVLFCGDLALRAIYAIRIAPFVAPAGGITLMAGWVLVAIAALRRP